MAHSCGSVAEIIPDLVEIGLDVLESVQPEAAGINPMSQETFGAKIYILGMSGSREHHSFWNARLHSQGDKHAQAGYEEGRRHSRSGPNPCNRRPPDGNAVAIVESFAATGAPNQQVQATL